MSTTLISFSGRYRLNTWRFGCLERTDRLQSTCDRLIVKLVTLTTLRILLLFLVPTPFTLRAISDLSVLPRWCSVLLYRCIVLLWCGVGTAC